MAAKKQAVLAQALLLARQPAGGGAPAILPAVPPPALPIPVVLPAGVGVPVQQGQITLVPGKATVPADTSTSVRVRLGDPKRYPYKVGDKEIGLVLEVSPEPRLRWQQVMSVTIEKAVDDGNQRLLQVMPEVPMGPVGGPAGVIIFPAGGGAVMPGWAGGMPFFSGNSNGLHQPVPIRFKKGDKESKKLKELKGTIAAQVLTEPEQFITATDVMKSAGKTFKGKTDGEIKINTATKNADGTLTITFDFTPPTGIMPETTTGPGATDVPVAPGVLRPRPGIRAVPPAGGAGARPAIAPAPAGGIVIGIGVAGMPMTTRYVPYGLTLVDDKGKMLPASISVNYRRPVRGGAINREFVATYRPAAGAAEPAKLVFTGRRAVALSIPFTLENVDLK